jgi:hypothetical protein
MACTSVQVVIGNTNARSVRLVAFPPRMTDSRTTQLTASVFDEFGNPVAGVPVYFEVLSGQTIGPVPTPAPTPVATPTPPPTGTAPIYEHLDSQGQPVFTDSNGQAHDVLRTRYPRDAPTRQIEVQASVPGQSPAGSKMRHTLWLTDAHGHKPEEKNVQGMLNFLVGCGVMERRHVDGKEVAVCVHDGSSNVTPKVLAMACNRIVWGPVKSWQKKGSDRVNFELSYGRCYQLDDPKYCRLPGDDTSADIAGYERVNGAYQKKGGEPAKQPVKTPAATSEFADI